MAQSGWGDTGEPMAALKEVEQPDSWLECTSVSISLVGALFTINCSNTRYEVLCSIALLLEITANLYAGRRNCEYE